MTKDEMIKALQECDAPGDAEVLYDISQDNAPEIEKVCQFKDVIILYGKKIACIAGMSGIKSKMSCTR